MPIRPLFDWEQTAAEVRLHLYFKSGVKREAVDALLTDTFIKINSPPYLLHVDLLYEIVPEESRHYFDAEEQPTSGGRGVVLHIHGKKSIAGKVWERLTINEEKSTSKAIPRVTELASSSSSSSASPEEGGERTSAASPSIPTSDLLSLPAILMSKKDVLARRQQSLQRAEKTYNAMLERRKEHREAEARRMTAAQWDVDKTVRQTIEGRMKAEKEAEEEALYAWEEQIQKNKNATMDGEKEAENGGRKEETARKSVGVVVQSPADVMSAFIQDHEADHHASPPLAPSSFSSPAAAAADPTHRPTEAVAPQTASSPSVPVPGVRQQETVRVEIDFTPRALALPTRARGDEDYYRQSRYKPVNVQDSPMFWKEKGDVLYKNHEFQSAADAYGESIKRDGVFLTCVMNRAACYLHLMEYEKAVQDSSLALNILANTPASELSQDRYRYLMCKLHARRGAALVWSEDLQRGRQDYCMAAAYADPETDTHTADDLAMVEALMRKRRIPLQDVEEKDAKDEPEEGKKKTEALDGGERTAAGGSSGREGEAAGTSPVLTPFRSWTTKMAKATAALYKGHYTEADLLYGEILACDPHYSLARSNRVVVRLLQKDFAAALKECHKIMEECHEVVQALQKTNRAEGGVEGEADSDDEEEEEDWVDDHHNGEEEDEEEEEESWGEKLGMREEEAREIREERKARRAANRDVVVLERRAAAKRIKESSSHVYLLLKAYVRAAAAFCGLKDFRSAHQYLQSALRITPYDNDLAEDVLRLEEKIRMETLISASTGGIPKKEK